MVPFCIRKPRARKALSHVRDAPSQAVGRFQNPTPSPFLLLLKPQEPGAAFPFRAVGVDPGPAVFPLAVAFVSPPDSPHPNTSPQSRWPRLPERPRAAAVCQVCPGPRERARGPTEAPHPLPSPACSPRPWPLPFHGVSPLGQSVSVGGGGAGGFGGDAAGGDSASSSWKGSPWGKPSGFLGQNPVSR